MWQSGLGGSHPVRGQTCSLSLLPHYKWLPFEPGCGCSVFTHSMSLGHRVVRQDTGQHSHGRRVGFPSPRQLFSGPLPITIMHAPAGQPPPGTADRCTLHFLCAFRFRTWDSFPNVAAPSPGPGPTCPKAQSSLAGSCLSGVGSQAPAPLLISVCLAPPSLGNLCSPPHRTSFVLE